MFRRIVFSAFAAGSFGEVLPAAGRQLKVVPVIPEAETYEVADSGVATIVATAITNAVFWLVLGTGCAIAFRKLA